MGESTETRDTASSQGRSRGSEEQTTAGLLSLVRVAFFPLNSTGPTSSLEHVLLSCYFPALNLIAYHHPSPLDLSMYAHKYGVEIYIENYALKALMYQFSSHHLGTVL